MSKTPGRWPDLRVSSRQRRRLDLGSEGSEHGLVAAVQPLTAAGLRMLGHPDRANPLFDPRKGEHCRFVTNTRGLVHAQADSNGQIHGLDERVFQAYAHGLDPSSKKLPSRLRVVSGSQQQCGDGKTADRAIHLGGGLKSGQVVRDVMLPDWLFSLKLWFRVVLFETIEIQDDASLEIVATHANRLLVQDVRCGKGSALIVRSGVLHMHVLGTFSGPV